MGLMIRDERPADFASLDARNIKANQRRITSQYFRNTRSLDTAHSKQRARQRGNPKRLGGPTDFNSERTEGGRREWMTLRASAPLSVSSALKTGRLRMQLRYAGISWLLLTSCE